MLDAGCGTGRVAAELARRGVEVVGVDRDPSMIATARRLAPGVEFHVADVADADLGGTFDLVVMAGNVPLFTPAGHPGRPGGRVRPPPGARRAAWWPGSSSVGATRSARTTRTAGPAGLVPRPAGRPGTGTRSTPADDYAVSVHRRPA